MLVLSRKIGEKIVVKLDQATLEALLASVRASGKAVDLEVTLIEVDRNKVRLGLTAPRSVPIYRSELLGQDGLPVRNIAAGHPRQA